VMQLHMSWVMLPPFAAFSLYRQWKSGTWKTALGFGFLGALPLDIRIREQTDSGKPTVVADPDGRSAEIYRRIARRVAVKISEQAKDMTSKFPNIVIQNT